MLFWRILFECSSEYRKTQLLATYLIIQLNVYVLFDHFSKENLLPTCCIRYYAYYDNLEIPTIINGFLTNDLLWFQWSGQGHALDRQQPGQRPTTSLSPHPAEGSTRLCVAVVSFFDLPYLFLSFCSLLSISNLSHCSSIHWLSILKHP